MFSFAMSVSAIVNAGCVGSGNLKTCNDSSGNSYTISKIGNTTYVNGSNSQTGSQWHQSSSSIGNTTYTNGTAANGGTWSQNSRTIGNTTYSNGTSSNGGTWNGTIQRNGSNTTFYRDWETDRKSVV